MEGMSVPCIEADYPAAWKKRRFKRRIVLGLLLVPGALLMAGIVGIILGHGWAPIILGFAFPLLFLTNCAWMWSLYLRCPRCSQLFISSKTEGKKGNNPFAKYCLNCGLALRHDQPVADMQK
jgi:hypothetical protein